MSMFSRKDSLPVFAGIAALGLSLYFLSFVGYMFPIVNTLLFALILLGVFYLTIKKLEYGVLIVLFEVAIGVKGYLFSFNVFGFPISLRIALFAMVFLVWLYGVYTKKYTVEFSKSKLFPAYALFTLMLMVGMIFGTLGGNSIANVFFDVNGYFYLAFIFPLYDVVSSLKVKKSMLLVVMAGGFALTLFSLFTAFQFTVFHQDSRPDIAQSISSAASIDDEEEGEQGKISHSITAKQELLDNFSLVREFENQKSPIYRWTQDVSVAEISYLAGPFFRVFSPGQVYSLMLVIIALFVVLKKSLKDVSFLEYLPNLSNGVYWAIGGISLITIGLGFSRSLWLGLLAGFLLFLLFIPYKKALKIAATLLLSLCILGVSLKFFVPDAYVLIEKRVSSIVNPSSESAGSNRVNILGPAIEVAQQRIFFGSGFGTTVEYESVVPEKFGTLRVFAFEWSYLDMVIEVGIFGLVLYLNLIGRIYQLLLKKKILVFQLLILALLITNITTPYLNHPLGIGLLIVAAAVTREDDE